MMKFLIAASVVAAMLAAPCMAQSADEAGKARANYIAADKNKDSKLSKAEFRAFINANAKDGLGRAGMVKRFGAYDKAFKRLDANKDGQITKPELAAARKRK